MRAVPRRLRRRPGVSGPSPHPPERQADAMVVPADQPEACGRRHGAAGTHVPPATGSTAAAVPPPGVAARERDARTAFELLVTFVRDVDLAGERLRRARTRRAASVQRQYEAGVAEVVQRIGSGTGASPLPRGFRGPPGHAQAPTPALAFAQARALTWPASEPPSTARLPSSRLRAQRAASRCRRASG